MQVNSAFLRPIQTNGHEHEWTPEKLRNGNWALKADNGKYLSRCSYCVKSSIPQAYIFIDNAQKDADAQWNVSLAP